MPQRFVACTASEFHRWKHSKTRELQLNAQSFKFRFLRGLSRALQNAYKKKELAVLCEGGQLSLSTLERLYYFQKNTRLSLPNEQRISYLLNQLRLTPDQLWESYANVLPINMSEEQLPSQDYLKRPKLVQQTLSVLQHIKEKDATAIASLLAIGGMGKSVLAASLGQETTIIELFPDGILWLQLHWQAPSDHPEDKHDAKQAIHQQAELLALRLEQQNTTAVKHTHSHLSAIDRLAKAIGDKSILLIIDDVWNSHNVSYLQEALKNCPQCLLLLTTRNQFIVDDLSITRHNCIDIPPLDDEEATQLLQAGLSDPIPSHYSQKIIAHGKRWPLLLELLKGQLTTHLKRQKTPNLTTACEQLLDQLEDNGALLIRDRQRQKKHRSIYSCLENSLAYLDAIDHDTPLRSSSRLICLQSLALFPEHLTIPVTVLAQLWDTSSSVALSICTDFSDLRLVHATGFEQASLAGVSLNDVLLDYMRGQLKYEGLYQMHQQDLLHRLSDKKILNNVTIGYILTHEPYHLYEAGEVMSLVRLLHSPRLFRKNKRQPQQFQDYIAHLRHGLENLYQYRYILLDHIQWVQCWTHLAQIELVHLWQPSKAIAHCERALQCGSRLADNHPAIIRAKVYLAYALGNAGQLYPALALSEENWLHVKHHQGLHIDEVIFAQLFLGWVQSFVSDSHHAENNCKQALDKALQHYPPRHLIVSHCQHSLAYTQLTQGQYHEAVTRYQQVLTDYQQNYGLEHPFVLDVQARLSWALALSGDHQAADILIQQSKIIAARVFPQRHLTTVLFTLCEGIIKTTSGKAAEAILLLEEGLTQAKLFVTEDSPLTTQADGHLALALIIDGACPQQALDYSQALLSRRQKNFHATHVLIARASFIQRLAALNHGDSSQLDAIDIIITHAPKQMCFSPSDQRRYYKLLSILCLRQALDDESKIYKQKALAVTGNVTM